MMETKADITNCFGVSFLPGVECILVGDYFGLLFSGFVSFPGLLYKGGWCLGNTLPLTLAHEVRLHFGSPLLVVGTIEHADKQGEGMLGSWILTPFGGSNAESVEL